MTTKFYALTDNKEVDKKLLSLGWTKDQLDSYLDELYTSRSVASLVEDFLLCATPEWIAQDADACGITEARHLIEQGRSEARQSMRKTLESIQSEMDSIDKQYRLMKVPFADWDMASKLRYGQLRSLKRRRIEADKKEIAKSKKQENRT